ncbi:MULTISPECIES: hypothetical protein [Gordonia]|jgi:hypothetical protein|uniref:Uncharacterized protein n=1 Tax=Gordonia malaquae NBRC 108250 TaxID=1223542 RepID=M3VBQ6_GORML|nr:hypothetical protein [Gordonia malaquae]GAC80678.1 hypothetical protein GM1_020_00420 [Gordonia malaquae NBRC 108250]SEC22721.1 hypothetical protein SAMN04488550_1503 [Gordonia malaquae]
MTTSMFGRIVAGLSACAIAATGVALSSGSASADEGLTYWEDGNSRFNQLVSDTTPEIGDTITITTQFQRKWADEYIYSVKELVPACLRYIEGSAGWGGSPSPADKVEISSGTPADPQAYVKVNAPSITSWVVKGLGSGFGGKKSVSMQFYVRESCGTGVAMPTSMHYGGSLGSGTYEDKGPTITVAKPPVTEEPTGTTTPTTTNPNSGNGSLDTGSLGSLFG